MSGTRPTPQPASAFAHFGEISTRWMDNDVYGHINNVVYYSFFDTAVNGYLIEQGALDIAKGAVIGLVVETQCNYFKPIAFPDTVRAGIRVSHLGTSSVRYEVGIFRNDETAAAAQGHFVHVYVDRASGRPVALPAALKTALAKLEVA
jgi:acyl-CoA thioester hydrolase